MSSILLHDSTEIDIILSLISMFWPPFKETLGAFNENLSYREILRVIRLIAQKLNPRGFKKCTYIHKQKNLVKALDYQNLSVTDSEQFKSSL